MKKMELINNVEGPENIAFKRGNSDILLGSDNNLFFDNFIWLTTKEAAEYLRISPKQLRKWVYQGRIKAYKLLEKSLRFKKSELEHLIEGGRVWE